MDDLAQFSKPTQHHGLLQCMVATIQLRLHVAGWLLHAEQDAGVHVRVVHRVGVHRDSR